MIEQCLQKNPADRPTAKQLLKHDFFKKAKDRSYIAKHLALKFQDRKKMEEKTVNRRKPPAVRAVRVSDSGEWKFSSGSDDESASGNDTTSADDAANKLKQLENQTVKNMKDLIEKNNLAVKSVENILIKKIGFFFSLNFYRINHQMNQQHNRMLMTLRWELKNCQLIIIKYSNLL